MGSCWVERRAPGWLHGRSLCTFARLVFGLGVVLVSMSTAESFCIHSHCICSHRRWLRGTALQLHFQETSAWQRAPSRDLKFSFLFSSPTDEFFINVRNVANLLYQLLEPDIFNFNRNNNFTHPTTVKSVCVIILLNDRFSVRNNYEYKNAWANRFYT